MDLQSSSYYFEAPPMLYQSQQEGNAIFCRTTATAAGTEKNPFFDGFQDPLCKLNLKETSDFVKSSFPSMSSSVGSESGGGLLLDVSAQRRREPLGMRRNVEAPPTPGRPIFSFSVSRKVGFPYKWEDAEKWLISGGGGHHSSAVAAPAYHHHHHHHGGLMRPPPLEYCSKMSSSSKHCDVEVLAANGNLAGIVTGSRGVLQFDGRHHHPAAVAFADDGSASAAKVLLKDKFTNEGEPKCLSTLKCSEPMGEGFLFGNAAERSSFNGAVSATELGNEVKHRDIGTEMTPLGSSTTSRCHSPFKSTSPARHNTPANRSGPLVLSNSGSATTIDITHFQECHLAKLHCGTTQFDSVTTNWSSREEEEEEISKSLRHFELNHEFRKSISESRTCAWDEEEKTKCCLRYQREEAKIQAWVNLQRAKAEAQSRKLEVKIEKMRSNLEDKLMKRMAIVHRKAEERRAASRIQHSQQLQKANENASNANARKITGSMQPQSSYFATARSSTSIGACGCFPCTNNNI